MPSNSAVRERVHAQIRHWIMSGRFVPGAPLVAAQIAGLVKASRTPVREALLQLAKEGLVVETPAGLAVKALTEEDVVELYEVRLPLEAAAARLAAEHMTTLHLAQIQGFHEQFAEEARRPDPDIPWLAAVNLDLHRAICQATRNRLLEEFTARMYDTMGRFVRTALFRPRRLAEIVDEHATLVAALAARDPAEAERRARVHMEQALASRLDTYRERQRRDASAGGARGGGGIVE
jgi:DNA-binding GntR family transcriptional regulator